MTSPLFLQSVKKLSEQNIDLSEVIGLAETLKRDSGITEAIQIYSLWVNVNAANPMLHVALFNMAVLMSDNGDLMGAKQTLERCVTLAPDFYPPYINLGTVLERLGAAGEAVTTWSNLATRLAAVTGPNINYKLTALKQVARVLESNIYQPNAELVMKQSLEIDPNQRDVAQHYTAIRMAQCEWPVVAPWEGVSHEALMRGTGPLSMNVYTDDPMLQLASSWNYCRTNVGYPSLDFKNELHKAADKKKGERLRIGYISSDLRHHAMGFILAEFFELHDRKNYEVFAYYCGIPNEDPMKARIRDAMEHWVDIRELNDEQAARRIMADKIDILVDLNGYTKDARTKVFAMRPAPVIVNWLGFPGSMGSPYHHYIVADDITIPHGEEHYYSEKVLRLPCYQPNDRKREVAAERPTRADMGLPEHAFVYCSFNGAQKISRHTFDRWMRILTEVPDSVLWLLEGSESINQRLREAAQARGVDPARLIFAKKIPNAHHLARYPLADLFLDTTPYGAHVTASDALFMGVPIVTFTGRAFAARVCASLVTAAGLPELVCQTPEQFVAKAIELGRNKTEIARLKAKLAATHDSCTLFDMNKLTHHLEKLYDHMWEEYRKDRLPRIDLRNLELYQEIGCSFDHEANEMIQIADYEGKYRAEIARRHHYCMVPEDNRLWTRDAIAEAEEKTSPKELSGSVIPLRKKKKTS